MSSEEPFRARRITPKPIVQGPQTAVVVGHAGDEIYTDEYGRIKVQFHWDRQGTKDEDSSCWMRVAQVWAGNNWGSTFIPRVGQEVVVSFLEGDPDQPLVTGSVYNAIQRPPYLGEGRDGKHKNDPNVSGIKSNSTKGGSGFNELRFDDTAGKEEIFMHAQKDMDVRVKNIVRRDIGADRHTHIAGNDVAKTDKSVWIEIVENEARTIGSNKAETIGADHDHLIKGNQNVDVNGTASLTVGQKLQQKVGQAAALEAGQEIHLKGGMKVIIEAGMQLSLKGPGGFVDIGPSGVTIQGTMVLINSGGAAGSGSGSSPTAAKQAEKKPPAETDDSSSGSKSSD
jgi:type VI secretion system secreted protein VgrG